MTTRAPSGSWATTRSPLVFRMAVRPNWLSDDRFWYRNAIPGGAEFILVDPARADARARVRSRSAGRRAVDGRASEIHRADVAVHRRSTSPTTTCRSSSRGEAASGAAIAQGATCTSLGAATETPPRRRLGGGPGGAPHRGAVARRHPGRVRARLQPVGSRRQDEAARRS